MVEPTIGERVHLLGKETGTDDLPAFGFVTNVHSEGVTSGGKEFWTVNVAYLPDGATTWKKASSIHCYGSRAHAESVDSLACWRA